MHVAEKFHVNIGNYKLGLSIYDANQQRLALLANKVILSSYRRYSNQVDQIPDLYYLLIQVVNETSEIVEKCSPIHS